MTNISIRPVPDFTPRSGIPVENFVKRSKPLCEKHLKPIEKKTTDPNIRRILDNLINEHSSKDNEIVGMYLFGSFARGNGNSNSDIDLCIVKKDGPEDKKKLEVDGIEITVIQRPVQNINYIFGMEIDWAIEQLQNCKVLYDPLGKLSEIVEYSKGVKISDEKISDMVELSRESLESAKDLIVAGEREAAFSCIQYSLFKSARAYLDSNSELYKGPKYIFQQLREADPELGAVFRKVIGSRPDDDLDELINLVSMINGQINAV